METKVVEIQEVPTQLTKRERADAALAELTARARNCYWKTRFGMSFAMMPGILTGLGGWFAIFFLLRPILGDDWAAGIGMVVYLAGVIGAMIFGLGRYSRRSASELSRIVEHADARAMKPLTDMVRSNVWAGTFWLLPILRTIVAALSRILDAVKPDDRNALDDADLAGLRSILTSCANHYGFVQSRLYTPEFIRTALRALTVLQDRHGADLAERLTKTIGVGRHVAEVKQIARDALPALREAALRARERAELLRPAEAPLRPDETLLRPIEAAPAGEAELLVRPADCD